jgi:Ras family
MESLREVERAEAVAMAEVIPEILLVLETSAKENTNVEQCFVELATELKVKVVKYFVLFYNELIFSCTLHLESTKW